MVIAVENQIAFLNSFFEFVLASDTGRNLSSAIGATLRATVTVPEILDETCWKNIPTAKNTAPDNPHTAEKMFLIW
ncbi:Uncharacterised protein, partial [Mycoplasmopsis synoviae]